jgi:regulation of enolase protein 1 (concanavalin A-like superfamily)
MANRENNPKQVVIRTEKKTDVWEKNSAGCTTKSGHSTHYKDTGITTNHYGKIIKK